MVARNDGLLHLHQLEITRVAPVAFRVDVFPRSSSLKLKTFLNLVIYLFISSNGISNKTKTVVKLPCSLVGEQLPREDNIHRSTDTSVSTHR
jgi:hypothetical protein